MEQLHPTDTSDLTKLQGVFDSQKKKAVSLRHEPLSSRVARLKKIRQWILKNFNRIHDATKEDMGKPYVESLLTEAYVVVNEVNYAIRHLRSWTRPRPKGTPLPLMPATSWTRYEPKGVVLIIAPWNFPFNLALTPLVHAIAAGNAAIIKPSEFAMATSELIRDMVNEIFPSDEVCVFLGQGDVASNLTALPFDHIFFTGSSTVGRKVQEAANQSMASVTLELGGKSPAYIHNSANIQDTARKITQGKFMNCGQTCIAPDYLLVDDEISDRLQEALIHNLNQVYTEAGDKASIINSKDYGRIIGTKHFKRINEMMDDAIHGGASVWYGGMAESSDLFFPPTVLSNVNEDMLIMREEIFGPILPVVRVKGINHAREVVQSKEKPLAIYFFGKSRKAAHYFMNNTTSGAFCWNETVAYFGNPNLPFGGVGQSGMGRSHGFSGFKEMSNERSFMKQSTHWNLEELIRPPYNSLKHKVVRLLLRYF